MEDSREKHSFRRGLALGALLAVAAFVLSGCTTAYFLPRFLGRRDSNEEQIDAKVQELNQYIEKYYLFDYEDEDVENGIYKGLMAGLGDVYTGYYTPEEYASFMEASNGSYSGIGAMMQQDYTTGIITVVRVFDGSPSAEAGLQSGDILYMVEGEEVTGIDLSLVVSELKGEEGTPVQISILRETDILEMTLTRKSIQVPTVESRMIDEEIGYIAITEFDDVTEDQFMTALGSLESQHQSWRPQMSS